jgi:hypothetical protein
MLTAFRAQGAVVADATMSNAILDPSFEKPG